ncbi:MAG: GMC family oxidoreductase N-terminal domain-containing protein [Pseudorhodobacter sp.]|nr:GMC family oxidoreductase N-terminal domain-containing protein [Pseudorhodobacter sp.]
MVHIRGNPRIFMGWRDAGCMGWGFDEVLPLFKRSKSNHSRGGNCHGQAGGLIVTVQTTRARMTGMFLEACAQTSRAGMTM